MEQPIGSRRFAQGTGYPHTDGRAFCFHQLAGTMGLCVQENHPILLVSRPHHHLPAPARATCTVRSTAWYSAWCAPGGIDQKGENVIFTPKNNMENVKIWGKKVWIM